MAIRPRKEDRAINEFIQEAMRQDSTPYEIYVALNKAGYDISNNAVRKRIMRMRKRGELPKSPVTPSHRPTEEGHTFDVDGNTGHFYAKTYRIDSLEKLIESAGIDLEKWHIYKKVVKAQEVFAKEEITDITYDGTQMYGTKKLTGELIIRALWHVHAYMIRKEPMPLRPVIRPVNVIIPKITKAKPIQRDVSLALIVADAQIGFEKSLRTAQLKEFHDREVLDLAVQIAQVYQPDVIDFAGDMFDLADWTDRFTRSPSFEWATQPALEEWGFWLSQFRMMCPSTKIVQHQGNHSKRLEDSIINNHKEGYGIRRIDELDSYPVLSIPYLCAFDTLDVEWVGEYPNDEWWLTPVINIEHGLKHGGGQSGNAVKQVLADAHHTRIFGHGHRLEIAYKRIRIGKEERFIAAAMCGCACHVDGRVPGSKKDVNWQQGMLMVYYTKDELRSIVPVHVANGEASIGDKHFVAKDRVSDLIKATKERWNY